MTECKECRYFIRYNEDVTCLMKNDFLIVDGNPICLMKNDFLIVDGCTIFPKDCKDFYGGDVE